MRAYGLEAREILGKAHVAEDLGEHYGGTLTEAELSWLIRREWARTADDVLWRRSKLGLRLTDAEIDALHARMAQSGTAPV